MRCLVCSLILLAACTSGEKRDPIPEDQLLAQREAFFEARARDSALNAKAFMERILRKVDAAGDQPVTIDILSLSGGGPKGAFGTGFLRAWGEIEEGPMVRPEFDIVSGISTGALMAPFAYLGEQRSYDLVDELYRNPKEDWVKTRSNAILGMKSSFADGAGLWRDVRSTLEPGLPLIAQAREQGRLLLIGTIDADLGVERIWNAGQMAVDGDQERFFKVLTASASYPGGFPAVEIDGHLHIDGGMGALFNAGLSLDWLQRAAALWQLYHGDDGKPLPTLRVWVVVNNILQVPMETLQPNWLATMGRGFDIGSHISTQVLLAAFIAGAKEIERELGWPVEMRFVAIPEREKLPQSNTAFDERYMRRLSDIGAAMGRDPASWQTSLPERLWPEDVELQPAK
ncbi:MAG: patatin-like phospholipase family protein [Planctomycetota bacterium]